MGDSPTSNQDHYCKNLSGRALLVWFVLIAAEIVHGILRAILLVPLVGEFRSNQIGVFTGSTIILVIAYSTIHWIGAARRRELLFVGAFWLLATVAFEVGFGRLVMGLPWERITADYNVLEGGLIPLGLIVLFFSPMIGTKLHGKR
ncbi:MAG: hypothetical protein ACF788_06115 [Novipirellula sp. JB048]